MDLIPANIFYGKIHCIYIKIKPLILKKKLAILLLFLLLFSLQESALSRDEEKMHIGFGDQEPQEGYTAPAGSNNIIKEVKIIPSYDIYRVGDGYVDINVVLADSINEEDTVAIIDMNYPKDYSTQGDLFDQEGYPIADKDGKKFISFNFSLEDKKYVGFPDAKIVVYQVSSGKELDSISFYGPIVDLIYLKKYLLPNGNSNLSTVNIIVCGRKEFHFNLKINGKEKGFNKVLKEKYFGLEQPFSFLLPNLNKTDSIEVTDTFKQF